MVALVANFIGGVIVPPNINQVVEQQPLDMKGFIDSAVMARLPRPPSDNIVPGVERINVVLPHGRLIIYLPSGAQPNSLGCVFIAPAGLSGLHGSDLGDGDSPEHLPYVQAGFAVCTYAMDGHLDNETAGDAARFAAFQQFRQSNAGLNNAADAINFVLSHIPEVSPNRLYTAGHSSAGGTALLLAAHEPRIKGCIAYAAASDFLSDAPRMLIFGLFDKFMPGALAFIERSNPRGHESRIKCPVFLFHALDDTVVLPRFSTDLAERFKRAGKKVELVTVPSGDHYDPMIQTGIPRAIAWLQQIDRARGGAQVPAPSASSGVTAPAFPPTPPMTTQPPAPATPDAGDGFTAPLSE
jgi:dipeptidyl aminopeptidase/acylaminoacyl peptidase